MAIIRQPEVFAKREYDVIVVGGGVYGAMLALEATFRSLRPLLLERKDFGAATSFNSLRIVHGGLRYLQSLDLRRHFESVRERRWFLANLPDLVHPLPCLMPLYRQGARRKSILRAALLINDLLSMNRNNGVPVENSLPGGRIVDKGEAIAAFPDVAQENLEGGAVWYDAAMPDSQRIVMELLRWAARNGADAANYVDVNSLSLKGKTVSGVVATDTETGAEFAFSAPVVINSTGPWSASTADRFGSMERSEFWPSLAWNLLTNKPALSRYALAVTPPRVGGPTYFLHPWKGRLFIGTGHAALDSPTDDPAPSSEQIEEMLDDINSSIPEVALTITNVDRVFSGILPATEPRSERLSTRPAIVDHSRTGGPNGLFSVCGVKFTTARRVASQALDRVYGNARVRSDAQYQRPEATQAWRSEDIDFSDGDATDMFLRGIGSLIANESVLNLRDLVFRRTDLWERRERALRLAPRIGDLFDWPEDRKEVELARLADELANSGSAGSAL